MAVSTALSALLPLLQALPLLHATPAAASRPVIAINGVSPAAAADHQNITVDFPYRHGATLAQTGGRGKAGGICSVSRGKYHKCHQTRLRPAGALGDQRA